MVAQATLRITVILIMVACVFLADQGLAGTHKAGFLVCLQLLTLPKAQLHYMQYFSHAYSLLTDFIQKKARSQRLERRVNVKKYEVMKRTGNNTGMSKYSVL